MLIGCFILVVSMSQLEEGTTNEAFNIATLCIFETFVKFTHVLEFTLFLHGFSPLTLSL